jgi:glycosyltransferase involved in cell wall biosynthesis
MYSVSNIERENEYPEISICMPIYNRNNFKRLIVSNLLKLDYDFNKIEFCLYDDGTEKFFEDKEEMEHFINIIKPIKFKYKYERVKKDIGEKRNLLVKLATHKYIAMMDSDDLYISSYLKHSLDILLKNKLGLVCSPQMLFLYPHQEWKLTGIDCQVKRMGHEATMVFTKKYFKAMGGFTNKGTGEGVKLIDGMNEKNIGKSEIQYCMICICHQGNSVSKDDFFDKQKIECKLSEYDKQLIKDALNINT